METNTSTLLFWVILLAFFWLGIFVIPNLLLRQAVSQVLDIFRQSHSLCSESPKTANELGLVPPSLVGRLFKRRDYKPYALQLLIKSGMVRLTREGKMCLLENKLPGFQRSNGST